MQRRLLRISACISLVFALTFAALPSADALSYYSYLRAYLNQGQQQPIEAALPRRHLVAERFGHFF